MEFKRKFSLSMYKNLKINLAEMSFYKDFINDERGDLYPLKNKSENAEELVENNRYILKQGITERLFCQFFPYATYEISFDVTDGDVGFSFRIGDRTAFIVCDGKNVEFSCGEHKETVEIPSHLVNGAPMIISCRPGAFDLYFRYNGKSEFLATVHEEKFKESCRYDVFSDSYVFLYTKGSVCVKEVSSYIDNGVSIADIRPIKYENGDVIHEGGKIYFTASIRLQEGNCQGIFSWSPTTSEINLTGVTFYDCGDGMWRNYVAPVIIYNREEHLWYVWVSSFEHKHILAYASFEGDPRFGINVVDVQFMEEGTKDSLVTDFVGLWADEDPDIIYDRDRGKWLLSICRVDPKTQSYVYVFFESDDPFKNYKCIGLGNPGAETGGSFVRINGNLSFVCGNDFSKKSEYRIYDKDGMRLAKFNYPDGGYRGWGSVIPLVMGSRKRYFWLTFDRHKGSEYGFSYGNLYCFEMFQ